ncbi:hypothetical protein [Rhodanobacter sp. C05]|nr:hypothetical protein [Rhodanobacter sp. C05]
MTDMHDPCETESADHSHESAAIHSGIVQYRSNANGMTRMGVAGA